MAMEDAPPVPQELSNCAQVSTKVNREIREKVGQSAKRSLAVHGQGGRGSYSGSQTSARCGRGKRWIFCLPGFVEDGGQVRFSRCRLPHFFLHVPKSWRTLAANTKVVKDRVQVLVLIWNMKITDILWPESVGPSDAEIWPFSVRSLLEATLDLGNVNLD